MFNKSQLSKGFSLIEVLIVSAILASIAGILMTGFRNYAGYQQYKNAVSEVSFVLDQARLSARSAVSDVSHGIHFTSNSITEFAGSTYNAADLSNVTTIYSLVTFQLNLSGGVDDVVFNKLTGLPSATGTVTIEGLQYDASTTLTITGSGIVQ